MKKIILIIGILLSCFFVEAQVKNLQRTIDEIPSQNFKNESLFTTQSQSSESYNFSKDVKDYTLAQVKNEDLQNLIKKDPYAIRLKVPYKGHYLTLKLIKSTFLDNASFSTESSIGKENFNYNKGLYYYGIVENSMNSLAAISFFDNNIIAVISTPSEGNIVIGKSILTHFASEEYIIYNDKDMLIENNYSCGIENLKQQVESQHIEPKKTRAYTTKCVKFYAEADYKMYQDFGNSVPNTINYVSGLYNIVATLYYNDSILIALNTVNVWTTTDPYAGAANTGDALDLFSTQMSGGFTGDLAHLLTTRSLGGGIAWLNVLCQTPYYKTGVSASLSTTLTPLPTFSWNSEVVTHECGHNIASPHTHACAWNGNNTRIDNCAGHYNVAYQEGNCVSDPVDPVAGGTIMSYCHLRPVGINLSNGFGPQPGALIRTKINSAACLSTCTNCPTNITITGALNDTIVESDTWIKANGTTSMASSAQIKIDPNPNNGYFQFSPANNSESLTLTPDVASAYFVAQAYNGCSVGTPAKPAMAHDEDNNITSISFNDFILYPNPALDNITISNPKLIDEKLNYDIISMDGKIIAQMREAPFNQQLTIELHNVSKGLYFIKIFNQNENYTIKFQKN